MIIKIFLALIAGALALFVSEDVLLSLSVPVLPERVTAIGLALLFAAFGLLLIAGAMLAGQGAVNACRDFFSARERNYRRLLFIQHRQNQLKQLFMFKTAQINYVNERKRKHLLVANHRKHIKSLANAIAAELLSIKPQLPQAEFQRLQQEINRYRKRLDGEALLKLQLKIAALMNHEYI